MTLQEDGARGKNRFMELVNNATKNILRALRCVYKLFPSQVQLPKDWKLLAKIENRLVAIT